LSRYLETELLNEGEQNILPKKEDRVMMCRRRAYTGRMQKLLKRNCRRTENVRILMDTCRAIFITVYIVYAAIPSEVYISGLVL
jgi:hypothetical protein